MTPLTVGSLFSGIGGLDLGLERAGMTIRWQVEIDPFCQKVLAKHWPEVKRYGDIKTLTGTELEPVDLICGGFPCQPVSVAGKRRGTTDERWLWSEFARLLRVVRPRYALIENVPGLLRLGMGEVLSDLAAIGYDAEWQTIPAAAFGAPHLRYRVFIVAFANGLRLEEHGSCNTGLSKRPGKTKAGKEQQETMAYTTWGVEVTPCPQSGQWHTQRCCKDVAYTKGQREGSKQELSAEGICTLNGSQNLAYPDGSRREEHRRAKPVFSQLPSLERLSALADSECDGYLTQDLSGQTEGQNAERPPSRIGGSDWWAVEPNVGRVAYGVPQRVDRLRGLGNAVVPQVAEWIGRRIMEARP